MCGIAGFWDSNKRLDGGHATAMADQIIRRGPDDGGSWADPKVGIALAHRRLSILDLSAAGRQPMSSASGRYVIVFNGEIYNHLEIRRELEATGSAPTWRGHADTETLLAAIEHWGNEATLKKISGMFAFALWDRDRSELFLARDRMGEKPLYYGVHKGVFLFGSEIKAIKCNPAFDGEIDRDSLSLFFRFNYIPAPFSVFKGIYKLPPGSFLTVRQDDLITGLAKPVSYWSFIDVAEKARLNPFEGSDLEAVKALDAVLKRAIGRQMLADVPLGAFLSGGIDSSTVVALMQAQSRIPVKTFTVGFHDQQHNEAAHAKAVAAHLGTEHHEFFVTAQEAMDVIPLLPHLYDEPFSDSSQIPTFLVSKLTRRHVTVSLSGDGGDELFGGYNRYFGTQTWWNRIKAVPMPMRQLISQFIGISKLERWAFVSSRVGSKLQKLQGVLEVKNNSDLYPFFVTHWSAADQLVIGARGHDSIATNPNFSFENLVEQMMALDALTYLPDDILVKVDRAAMGVSLETRVPLLDPEVVEFAWRLPMDLKIRGGSGKWILKKLLHNYVPSALVDRPKQGFAIPLAQWLRGPLRPWAESLLDERKLKGFGYLDHKLVRKRWSEHLAGTYNWAFLLWDVLMFQAWFEQEAASRSQNNRDIRV
jgi:asparagine synthase (glutamine-hydrolysing)